VLVSQLSIFHAIESSDVVNTEQRGVSLLFIETENRAGSLGAT